MVCTCTAAATAVKDLTAIEHVESAVNPFVVPLAVALFFFILIANWIELIPTELNHDVHLLPSPTASSDCASAAAAGGTVWNDDVDGEDDEGGGEEADGGEAGATGTGRRPLAQAGGYRIGLPGQDIAERLLNAGDDRLVPDVAGRGNHQARRGVPGPVVLGDLLAGEAGPAIGAGTE